MVCETKRATVRINLGITRERITELERPRQTLEPSTTTTINLASLSHSNTLSNGHLVTTSLAAFSPLATSAPDLDRDGPLPRASSSSLHPAPLSARIFL